MFINTDDPNRQIKPLDDLSVFKHLKELKDKKILMETLKNEIEELESSIAQSMSGLDIKKIHFENNTYNLFKTKNLNFIFKKDYKTYVIDNHPNYTKIEKRVDRAKFIKDLKLRNPEALEIKYELKIPDFEELIKLRITNNPIVTATPYYS